MLKINAALTITKIKKSILAQMDKKTFESKFAVRVPGGIDNLNYPVITFHFYSNGREAGTFFDKNCTYNEIYTGAKDYFEKK